MNCTPNIQDQLYDTILVIKQNKYKNIIINKLYHKSYLQKFKIILNLNFFTNIHNLNKVYKQA